MSPKIPVRILVLLAAIPFVMAIWIGRTSPLPQVAERLSALSGDTGPESVLVKTGSVEARLRAMEGHLLELRGEVAKIKSERGPR